VYKWQTKKGRGGKTTYARRTFRKSDGKQGGVYLHQEIARRMGIVGNPDHIDRDGLNCCERNLRPDPNGRNMANREGWGKSGYKGVHWYKLYAKWLGNITINRKTRHLGYFTDPIEAALVYDTAALEAFGEFAVPNFPRSCPGEPPYGSAS